MISISGSMTSDHRRCDEIFVNAENAILKQNWEVAQRTVRDFSDAMTRHFSLEEDVLFPAIQRVSSQASGPIGVMTVEHAQIRHLIEQLVGAVENRLRDEARGIIETLLITMQQHNMKEEHILYQIADRAIPELGVEIAERIQE